MLKRIPHWRDSGKHIEIGEHKLNAINKKINNAKNMKLIIAIFLICVFTAIITLSQFGNEIARHLLWYTLILIAVLGLFVLVPLCIIKIFTNSSK